MILSGFHNIGKNRNQPTKKKMKITQHWFNLPQRAKLLRNELLVYTKVGILMIMVDYNL